MWLRRAGRDGGCLRAAEFDRRDSGSKRERLCSVRVVDDRDQRSGGSAARRQQHRDHICHPRRGEFLRREFDDGRGSLHREHKQH